MSDDRPTQPYFLIIADYDRGFFTVEGPMTDDRAWNDATRNARDHQRHVVCGPAGPDRGALAAIWPGPHRAASSGRANERAIIQRQRPRQETEPARSHNGSE